MLFEELAEAWRKRERDLPITPEPTFRGDALILGAGTVLGEATEGSPDGLAGADADRTRMLTLLSVAYGRAVGSNALSSVRRASIRWREGDHAMASMHLAMAKLCRLPQPREAARRLFLADQLLEKGAEPEAILRALDLDVGALARLYNPNQPRVPAGHGVESGQWTSGDAGDASAEATPNDPSLSGSAGRTSAASAEDAAVDALSRTPAPADVRAAGEAARQALAAMRAGGTIVETMPPGGWVALARIAATLSGPTVFFGVLLIPTNTTLEKEGDVPGHPGFFYQKLPGEVGWHISYVNDQGGGIEVPAGPDGIYRDAHGQTIARLLPNGALALDLGTYLSTKLREKPAGLCPAPSPDKPGQGEGARSKLYEIQMKLLLNPEAPTPPNLGRALPNSRMTTGIVIFDDCWLQTGDMFEYKGPGYARLISASAKAKAQWGYVTDWLTQSLAQVHAAGATRRLVRCFAEPEAARAARELFDETDRGREKIVVGVFPYLGG